MFGIESHSACLCWQKSYRIAIQAEGMIEDLVKNLSCDNQELQMHCASAIFKVHAQLHFSLAVYKRDEVEVKLT